VFYRFPAPEAAPPTDRGAGMLCAVAAQRRSRRRKGAVTCVSGATGFLGAHVTRLLVERGDRVRVAYRNADRLEQLGGLEVDAVRADVRDREAMRTMLEGADVLYHTAGYVGSSPVERVWDMNAVAPRVAVEAAAAAGVRRVVVTSTISAVGPARGTPADEDNPYPAGGLDMAYPDAKRQGEIEALETGERTGVDVVCVNPAYVLGVPVNRGQAGETSTRTVGNYLRGRLPAVIDAFMNFVDVEDVAAGHLLAAEHGRTGQRYILGGENLGWVELVERLARFSGRHHALLVLPREIALLARARETLRLPGLMASEGYALMGQDWRYTSAKAARELGYDARPLDDTLRATIEWYEALMAAGVFEDEDSSALSAASSLIRGADRVGLLNALPTVERVTGRRLVAGR